MHMQILRIGGTAIAVALFSSSAPAGDCLIVGDSIAKRLGTVMRECRVSADGGLTAREILPYVPVRSAAVVILSAGSNRPNQETLPQDLASLRNRVSSRVIWVLPVNPRARALVAAEAQRNGDKTVEFTPSPDGKHPSDYGAIAAEVRKLQ